jgi:hypothetical protein
VAGRGIEGRCLGARQTRVDAVGIFDTPQSDQLAVGPGHPTGGREGAVLDTPKSGQLALAPRRPIRPPRPPGPALCRRPREGGRACWPGWGWPREPGRMLTKSP